MKIVITAEELTTMVTDAIKKAGVRVSDDAEVRLGLVGGGDETALLAEVIADVSVEIG
jgi:hypothetical protein